ncbi:MAG: DbpA RNA binding domain-containing protein [Hymenobacter sp.]
MEKGNLEKYVGRVQRLLDQSEEITSLDIAAALLKMTMKEDKRAEQSLDASTCGRHGPRPGFTRLFVTMGKKDRIHPRDIVDLIAESSNLAGDKVGDIALYDKFSFVEVPSRVCRRHCGPAGPHQHSGPARLAFSIATPVQDAAAKEEGLSRTRAAADPAASAANGARASLLVGGDRREGGSSHGGGYKATATTASGDSYGDRREGGSGYGGGYKGSREGGSSYGNRGGSQTMATARAVSGYSGGNREAAA